MKTTILILALVALAAASPKPTKLHYRNLFKQPAREVHTRPSPRIIGGQEAEPHSIPYQVFLEVYAAGSGWYCGGSLISENYVLTAGHCAEGADEANVILGAHTPQVSEDTQKVLISTTLTVHEEYDSLNIVNDIAVIQLPEAVELTDAIQTVALPSSADADNTYEGETGRVSGWGLTDGFDDQISEVLNYVDVAIISNADCEIDFGDLPDSNICTSGVDNTGSCNGDSGGPLVVNDVQVGVVSFGIVFCLPGFASGYSRVTSFLDWIATNTDVQIQ